MKYCLSVLLVFLYAIGFSQTRTLSLEDAMLKARTTLAPENLKGLQFMHGTNDYVYLKKIDNYEVWVKGNAALSETTYMTLANANQFFSNAQTGELKTMPMVQFNKGKEWIASIQGMKMAYNPITKTQRIIYTKDIGTKQALEEASNENVAYVEKNNIYIKTKSGTRQITVDGTDNLVLGQSVHRDEFGISKGLFWSNDGNALAFYKMDQSMVTDYPIIDWTEFPAKNNNTKYPMAGGTSHKVQVGVYDINTDKTIYLQTVQDDHYLTNLAWAPDHKTIFIAEVARTQDQMQLNQYDAKTGQFLKTIFSDRDDKYIEPSVPMQFLPNNPNQFIWQSNRSGFNHLYLYDLSGKIIKQLTQGNAEVLELKTIDATGENIFYIQADALGLTKKLYSVNIKSGKSVLLTIEDGVHTTQISSTGKAILDVYSNRTTPRIAQLIDLSKKQAQSKNILKAANPLADYVSTRMDLFTIDNGKGTKLNVKTYYPPNYNASNKYPTIVYWYGGPHAQMVNNSWNAGAGDYWFYYMAQQGYIVIVPDVRGSDHRGKEFEQSIFREVNKAQMEDLKAVLDSYKNTGVDFKRMGLFGWSFGGFLTTSFVLNHPGVFKAAVAGGPVMDWSLYEVMYTERYMDTPKENPDGYKKTNLIEQAGKLKDKLLLIHGIQDNVVVQQHSVNFVKACVDKGVQVDYMIYPGHEHNVLGKDRVHLYKKVTDYFDQHLKQP